MEQIPGLAYNTFPVLASKAINGISLDTILLETPDRIRQIDSMNFSTMVILAMLTNPGDAKPDNYKVISQVTKDDPSPKLFLVGIDNDNSFFNEFVDDSGIRTNIQCALFYFPQMDDPVNAHLRVHFLSLVPELIMIEWLKSIASENKVYSSLLMKQIFTVGDFEQLSLPVNLTPTIGDNSGTVATLYSHITSLQKAMEKNPDITHRKLFDLLHPITSRYYEKFREDYNAKTAPENQSLRDLFFALYEPAKEKPDIAKLVTPQRKVNSRLSVKSLVAMQHPLPFQEELTRTLSPVGALEEFIANLKWVNISINNQKIILDALLGRLP